MLRPARRRQAGPPPGRQHGRGPAEAAPGVRGDAGQLIELIELIATLAWFRSLAMTSATATLARSMETTVEGLLGDYLERFLDNTPMPDAM